MPSHPFTRQPSTAAAARPFAAPNSTTVFVSHVFVFHDQPASHPAQSVFPMFTGNVARRHHVNLSTQLNA